MAKIRVHEIAKELGIPSKEMVDTLQKMGLDVKNHMSTLEDSQASWIKKQLSGSRIEKGAAKPQIEPGTGNEQAPERRDSTSRSKQNVIPRQIASGTGTAAERHSSPPTISAPHTPQRDNRHENPASLQGSKGQSTGAASRPNQNNQGQRRPFPENVDIDKKNQDNRPFSRPAGSERSAHEGRPAVDNRPFQDRRPPANQRPGFENRRPSGQPGTVLDRRTAGEQQRPAFDRRPSGPPRPGQDRRPPGEQKTASGAGLKPVPPSPKPVDRKSGYVDQRPVGAPNRPFQEQKKNDYERQKAAKKNAPPIQVRDYGRPPKKSKHKRKKEEVFMPLPDKIVLAENIMVRDLAEKLHRSSAEIVKKLMELGTMATINQVIDYDTAEIVASLYEVKVEREVPEEERILEEIIDDEASLKPRPPVVTVMGHVDHGKTSLLDRIRQADVASGEAGGITQHIGAYQVKVNDNYITFIDTPGHEAFTAMRARGANLTDIVVLVVAADDGVMPQTVEAINHIRAANVPFLVAVNKIDKPNANPDRVMQQLGEHGIVSEDWGGDIIFVPVSAKSGEGIETLLEMILLLAEINDIKSNPDRSAEGVVIEGELDKGRGPVATVLVQKGTLRIGDSLLCGSQICRVRAMTDARGRRVDTAYPSMPVEITGWPEVPEAGGRVRACDEKIAKQIVELRLSEKKLEEQKQSSRVSLDDFFKQMQDSDIKELNLIIKGDVQGSVEALSQSLLRLTTNEVKVNVIHSAVGAITETDVMLASASRAIIIGFNVRPDIKAKKYAEDEGIDVLLYRVIYEAIDDVKKAMVGLLDPEYREKYMGRAEVRALFKVPNVGIVAGCYVVDGKITRNSNVRVLRDGVIIYDGKLASLKRFKDDAKEVLENFECGMGIKDFNDLKEGDFIEAYTMEEIPRQL